MDIRGKLVVISGASSGIGAATAMQAAQAGARVVLVARSAAKLQAVADGICATGGEAHAYPADLTDLTHVEGVVGRITRDVGVPDVLFNNAGLGQWLFIDETAAGAAAAMMAAPYGAAFELTRAFLPGMLVRNSGTIINMTSIAAFMAWPGASAYTAARWAMRGFNEALRADLYGTGLRTMLVTFATVESDYWQNNPDSERRVPGAQRMIPRLTPVQAAEAILKGLARDANFLAAPLMLRVILALNHWSPEATRRQVYSTGATRGKAGGR